MKRRKKTDICIFEVKGRGYFPLDMLRYDACWPHRQEDVTEMCEDSAHRVPGERAIQMASRQEPTIRRWESFGWTVNIVRYVSGS